MSTRIQLKGGGLCHQETEICYHFILCHWRGPYRPFDTANVAKMWNTRQTHKQQWQWVSMGIHEDCNERENDLYECIRIICNNISARTITVTLQQQGVNSKRILERHISYINYAIYLRSVLNEGAENCSNGSLMYPTAMGVCLFVNIAYFLDMPP